MPDNGKKNVHPLEGTFWLISTSQKRGPTMRVFVWVGIDATIAQCPRNKENSELKMCVNNGYKIGFFWKFLANFYSLCIGNFS